MNGVLAETTGRGDILLLRGITNRLAVKWERDSGSGFQPVDLTDWTCRFELFLPSSDDPVYRQDCNAHGADGISTVEIMPDAFRPDIWASRRAGEWRMTATENGVTELLGSGYWHLG